MLHTLWNVVLYEPLYNALIFLVSIVPGADIGIAVILLTILVKLILAPLTKKSVISQMRLKEIEPEIEALKKEYPNKEEQAKKTFELYKKYNVNPFSGCLLILIQLPIIFALYYVFLHGLGLKEELLYSFVHFPAHVSTTLFGIMDIQGKSLVLALLAGITQFIQLWLTTPIKPNVDPNDKSFKTQMMNNMSTQMKYVLPVFITFVAYTISAVVALYWVTSNIFTIGQEMLIRRKRKKQLALSSQ